MTTGVRWLSIGPGTGYGNASEAYLSGLRTAGVPVTWTPIGWPSSTWDAALGPVTDFARFNLDDATHIDVANRAIEHDVVVVFSTPLWEDELAAEADGRLLVAYTTWETDRVWPEWVATLNCYDRVLVPSRFNAGVFKASGVTSPLFVVPFIARPGPRPDPPSPPDSGGTFVFYVIATWVTRKAILDVVSAYLTAFTAADDVVLVIHTTPEDQIASGRVATEGRMAEGYEISTWFTLAKALAGRANAPRIRLSARWLPEPELDALHAQGNCYVCLSRGEGWGLGGFDAAAFGNPVLTTGWGGPLDYLPDGYPYCVPYDLVPTVTDEPDAWWAPRPGEHWAKARIGDAAELLRHIFDHRDEANEWGRTLQTHVRANFAGPDVTRRLIEALDP